MKRRAAAAVAALALAAPDARGQWPPWLATDSPPPTYPSILIGPDSLAGGGRVVLDARSPAEWERGTIPGALSAPPDSLAAHSPAIALGALGLTGTERVAVAGPTGDPAIAARLFWILETAGMADVAVLDGGVEAWTAAGRALESPRRAGTSAATFAARPDTRRRAERTEIRERYGRPDPGQADFEILDVRVPAVWETGHVPHSLPFDPAEVLRPDGRFAPPESIRAHVDGLGPRAATTVDLASRFVVVDDGGSGSGALAYLALRVAAVADAAWFPCGMAEWVAHAEPVVRIVSAAELAALLDGRGPVVLADVRGRPDWTAGHLPGARPVSPVRLADSLATVVAREWPDVDRAQATFVAYCYGEECVRSRNCTTVATRLGFREVLWFRGGMAEWKARGAAVEAPATR